jgi:hypothetical protein
VNASLLISLLMGSGFFALRPRNRDELYLDARRTDFGCALSTDWKIEVREVSKSSLRATSNREMESNHHSADIMA